MVEELGLEMAPETAQALEKAAQKALAKALELQKAKVKE
jgi:hypothetical protein